MLVCTLSFFTVAVVHVYYLSADTDVYRLFDATDEQYIQTYICPPFLDCIVTSSGIKEKEKIKALIEKGGEQLVCLALV